MVEPLAPAGDEIVLPKTASGVFNATNIEYVLRNIGIDRIAICGVYTNQCVESAVRDAADRGFLVTLVEDACAATSQDAHDADLKALAGYARVLTTAELLSELDATRPSTAHFFTTSAARRARPAAMIVDTSALLAMD